MKKAIILTALLLGAASAQAQNFMQNMSQAALDQIPEEYRNQLFSRFEQIMGQLEIQDAEMANAVHSVSEPDFEWSEMGSKQIKVRLTDKGLQFESKEEGGVAYSIAELPINLEENSEFTFGVLITGVKLDDKKCIGLIFDYEDSRTYKGISIFKKQFEYFVVKDGVMSTVKTGLVKTNNKSNVYGLTMSRANGKVEFKLDGLEICTLKRVSIDSPMFGAFIRGKMKAIMPSFIMYNAETEDTEQTTTDN